MTKSMTAFARFESGAVSWEVRSVNHRYLDTTFKIPERFRSLEPELRSTLRGNLHRGKVDCLLRVNFESDNIEYKVDKDRLTKLINAIGQVNAITGNSTPVNPFEFLRWPGVMLEVETDQSELEQCIKQSFEEAISSVIGVREREGAELERIILVKLNELESIVQAVRLESSKISERQKRKILEKLEELKTDIDNNRLEQELVYLAQKSDILEELVRLDMLVEEVRNTLSQDEAIGRRLDFLMQELNREANTLSSKAVAANTSIQAVELKVIIEQMREQVQNIE